MPPPPASLMTEAGSSSASSSSSSASRELLSQSSDEGHPRAPDAAANSENSENSEEKKKASTLSSSVALQHLLEKPRSLSAPAGSLSLSLSQSPNFSVCTPGGPLAALHLSRRRLSSRKKRGKRKGEKKKKKSLSTGAGAGAGGAGGAGAGGAGAGAAAGGKNPSEALAQCRCHGDGEDANELETQPGRSPSLSSSSSLERFFEPFRENTVGIHTYLETPAGGKIPLVYADYTASGRLYHPIEKELLDNVGVFLANTHTEASITGRSMTKALHYARDMIKHFVGANDGDALFCEGTGMTGALAKFARMMGMLVPARYCDVVRASLAPEDVPLVIVTHMEHHSNDLLWQESVCDFARVEMDPLTKHASLAHLEQILREDAERHPGRKVRLGAFTAASNVTGIINPVRAMAKLMHSVAGGLILVDYAASGPYVEIDMHPQGEPGAHLDAIVLSPHKFLGGPGSCGVLCCRHDLVASNPVPERPGGGTVSFVSPFGHAYFGKDTCMKRHNMPASGEGGSADYGQDHQGQRLPAAGDELVKHNFQGHEVAATEAREDGGTPGFLQVFRAALAFKLKDEMGVERMLAREEELLRHAFDRLSKIPGLFIHEADAGPGRRIGIVSFGLRGRKDPDYNLVVSILSNRFGIETRGGCSCAGVYGTYLLELDFAEVKRLMHRVVTEGCSSAKPGWVRLSLHPTLTDAQLDYICDAIHQVSMNIDEWRKDYVLDSRSGEYSRVDTDDADPVNAEGRWSANVQINRLGHQCRGSTN